MTEYHPLESVADQLCLLYEKPFGGKKSGRFRISMKLVRLLAGRQRLYEDDIRDLQRAMAERGHVLVDMDTFFVVMRADTFVNYRRVSDETILSEA
jgi:hypothetical protein